MSYRELWVLVQYLPQESWTQTILRDEQLKELVNPGTAAPAEQKFGPWALVNYQIAELTNAINRVWYATAVGKFENVEPLPPMPRPGGRPGGRQGRQPIQSDAAILYLEKLRARG